MKDFLKILKKFQLLKKEKKYMPPMSHPFKASSFKKYQEKQASRTHIGFGTYCYN